MLIQDWTYISNPRAVVLSMPASVLVYILVE